MDLLQSLGRNTVVVRPPPPSSNVTDPTPSEYGLGALYHFRVDKKLSLALGRFNVEAEEEGLDVIEGQEGVARLREQRVEEFQWSTQYGDDAVLVQDWTLLETMGEAMAEVIRRKQKFGARRWISMGRARKTRGSKKSDGGVGVRMLLGGAWLIVAAMVVRPLWQRGQLSAKGSGRLGPK